jgi:hypothetical protein
MLDAVNFPIFTRGEMNKLAQDMESTEIERRLRFLADKCEADIEFNKFAGYDLMKAIRTTLIAGADYIAKTREKLNADSAV